MAYPDLPGVPHEFGALELDPVPVLEPAGDIVINVIGQYLQAVLNAKLSEAWAPLSGGSPIVRTLQFNNPEDNTFSYKDLPALYVFRDKSDNEKPERVADDLWQDTMRVIVYWIADPVRQQFRAERAPFANAVRVVIKDAIFQERDPSWKKDGETDAYAMLRGSSIFSAAGLWEPPTVEGVSVQDIQIDVEGATDNPKVPIVKATIRTCEGSLRNATGYPLTAGSGTVQRKDGTVVGTFATTT